MSKLQYKYSYVVLRYIHDIATDEFVNVGVVIHCAKAKYSAARFRDNAGRLHKVFPTLNTPLLTKKLRKLQSEFDRCGDMISTQLDFNKFENVVDVARSILPHDDSSLQWSPIKSGLTNDPNIELDKLFDRFVALYDDQHLKAHRSDDDIWRTFKKDLEKRNLYKFIKNKIITVEGDEVEFHHAWKNGKWHCLQPLSFDLSSPGHIKDKAHKWLGQMTSISSSNEKFKLYLLLGMPQDNALAEEYSKALKILQKIPGKPLFFNESQSAELVNLIDEQLQGHLLN